MLALRRADTFHKPGFKMHAKILHHLFHVIATDVIKAPLWDVASLGPAAFANNAAFVHQHVSQLLTTSFPNLRPQQVDVSARPHIIARRWHHACLPACTALCYAAASQLQAPVRTHLGVTLAACIRYGACRPHLCSSSMQDPAERCCLPRLLLMMG